MKASLIQKAENYLNDENYTKSANYYAKAINTTANQIGTEESASTKYTSKANSVLKKAQKQGLITSKQASSIKSSVANGTMNIASYSDEVQEVISSYMEWTDKATEASDAVDELHANIQTYIQDLKDLRDAQRDATIESTETYESIATSGYAYTATEKNSQLGSTNNQLRAQNTAYSTATAAVASDTATIASNGTSAITSALSSSSAKKNSAYKKALQNAQKAINSNTAVSDSDLNTIKSYSSTVYEKLYAYNEALENLETARLEEATNYAATRSEIYDNIAETYENMDSESEDKIDLYEQKASNASSASEANKYLSAAASQYDTILSNDRAEISRYSSDITGYKSTISGTAATSALSKLDTSMQEEVSTYTEKARSAAKSGVAIEAYVLEKLAEYYSKGYITAAFYNACVDYNNALAYKEQAEAQLEIDEQTAKAEKASLGQSMVENIQSEYENKRSTNASATSLLQAQQATITASGGVLSEENYQDLIEQSQEEQQILSDERDALLAQIQENLASGLWDENTQEYLDAVGTVTDLETEIEGCVQDQIEYNAAIINLPIEKLETLLELTDAITASMQSLISLNTAKGLELTLYDEYIELLGEQAEQVTYYYNLMQEALQNYYAAVENGGTYGDKSTADWLEDFYNYRSSMYSAKEAYVDTTNAIIQLPFDSYDEIVDLYEAAISYEESLQSLREAQGKTYTESDYATRLGYIKTEIAQLEKERDLAYKNYQTAQSSSEGVYGGKTANEWMTEYFGYLTDINGLLEEIEDINNDIVDSVYEQLEGYADLLAAITEYDQALNDIKETRGISLDMSDYQTVITDMQNQIKQYTAEMEQLYSDWQTAIANGGSYADKTADEWGVEYYNMGTTINNLVSDIEELYNEIAQMPYDEIQATLDLIEAISDYNESAVSLKEALGTDLDASDYWTQISDLQDQITQYEAEQAQAIADYKKAQESDDGVYGSKTADEWLAEYYEYSTEINNLTADIEELKDSLRDDVFWRTFERAHDACSRLSDVLSGIKDLIDEDMYFDADGNMTDFGVAQLANIIHEYENASEEVQNYSNDIANLNQLYEDGWYTEEEYNEMLAQLQSSMLDAASNMKDAMQEVIDILKQEAELELESLQDIITARKDALQSKSDYYSYNKTISEKNADVESLKSQIAALENVTDAASRAKKAQLEAQLAESESDLQDEIYEHSIELSETALDELSDSLSDAFDEYWDSVTSDLDEMMNLLQAANDIYAESAVEVVDTLNKLLSYYGIDTVSTGVLEASAYASGTKSLKGDQLTLTQEDGTEAIVLPDGSILTPLPDGTSIFNAAQTGNLWDWSKLNPYDYTAAYTPDATAIEEAKIPGEINVHYDSLLTVNGDVSKDTLPELKTILEKSYEYTVREIKRDARKVGIKT
ncbi:MAG: hypothetical protein LUI14_05890 [Lachnospiraceae bacterium]|nr:hypothetical protein [Lachnospiraceae bacterium]